MYLRYRNKNRNCEDCFKIFCRSFFIRYQRAVTLRLVVRWENSAKRNVFKHRYVCRDIGFTLHNLFVHFFSFIPSPLFSKLHSPLCVDIDQQARWELLAAGGVVFFTEFCVQGRQPALAKRTPAPHVHKNVSYYVAESPNARIPPEFKKCC